MYSSVFGRVKAARLQSTKKKDFVRNVATKDMFLAVVTSGMLSDKYKAEFDTGPVA